MIIFLINKFGDRIIKGAMKGNVNEK